MRHLSRSGTVLALFIGTMRAGGADGDGAEQLIERLREEWRSDEETGKTTFEERREITVSSCNVGAEPDKSALRFDFPAGTFVTDLPAMQAYIMGFSGKKFLTPVQPYRDAKVINSLPAF